jgi:hypothetical protein
MSLVSGGTLGFIPVSGNILKDGSLFKQVSGGSKISAA